MKINKNAMSVKDMDVHCILYPTLEIINKNYFKFCLNGYFGLYSLHCFYYKFPIGVNHVLSFHEHSQLGCICFQIKHSL